METLRIHYLAALIVPTAYAIACGGSDNPPANNGGGGSTGTGGSSSGNGGSTTGNGGSTTGNGGTTTGNGGSITGNGGGGGRMGIPMETIVPDPSCPDLTLSAPEGGVALPDGGRAMIPRGFFGDGGTTTLKGCCDQTGICGVAFVNDFTFGGQTIHISNCFTPNDIPMGAGAGFDAGPTKACTYKAP